MTPLVSIVIPTATRPHYLFRAIDSALSGMNNSDIEIIVVPNGPDDSWRESLAPYRDNQSVRVIPIKEANANIARNAGLNNSRGEYIRFLDDDDYLIPQNAVRQYELIQSSGSDVVSGSVKLLDESGRCLRIWLQPKTDDLIAGALGPWRNGLIMSHVYRKSSLGDARWNPATIVRQDVEWLLDLCASKELAWNKTDDIVAVWQHHRSHRISSKIQLNEMQKITVSMLLRTYESLKLSNRINDLRREAVVWELWNLINTAFFLEPSYWHKVGLKALEVDPAIRPLVPLHYFSLIFNLNPLLKQWLVLPQRWIFNKLQSLPKKIAAKTY